MSKFYTACLYFHFKQERKLSNACSACSGKSADPVEAFSIVSEFHPTLFSATVHFCY